MKVKVISENEKKTRILMTETTPEEANAIRRTIISEVPVLAIEDVVVVNNSSAMYDEMIALRLGLIPLKTDLKLLNLPEKCSCKGKGCNKCRVEYFLKEKGPKVVYSGDLKTETGFEPVFKDIPITKLMEGQEVNIKCIAVLGKGLEHTKWSPGLAVHSYVPVINVKKHTEKEAKECIKHCDCEAIKLEKGKIVVDNDKLIYSEIKDSCLDACKNILDVKWDDTRIIMTIEPWGQIGAKTMFNEATKILKENYEEFLKEIKKLN